MAIHVRGGRALLAKAFDLISFESIYEDVFLYVFGDTLVFNDLSSARLNTNGFRSVTLTGELIEKSGAMTGGSFARRSSSLTFGTSNERDEIEPIRERLLQLGETLVESQKEEVRLTSHLDKIRPYLNELEQRHAALDAKRLAFNSSNKPLIKRLEE